MILGAAAAMAQNEVKRYLAYSSIGHSCSIKIFIPFMKRIFIVIHDTLKKLNLLFSYIEISTAL